MLREMAKLRRMNRRQTGYLAVATLRLLAASLEFRLRSTETLLARARRAAPRRVARSTTFDVETAMWAIDAVAPRLPWRSDCLIRALAALAWLHKHGYEPHLHLGIARSEHTSEPLAAHAWVTLEERIVQGGVAHTVERFSPLS